MSKPINDSLKDKAAKGFLWGALNNGAMQVLNAVFGIILARILSQDDYGLVGMLTVFTAVLSSFSFSLWVSIKTSPFADSLQMEKYIVILPAPISAI